MRAEIGESRDRELRGRGEGESLVIMEPVACCYHYFLVFILHILPVHQGPPATRSKPQMRLFMENDNGLVMVRWYLVRLKSGEDKELYSQLALLWF